jgi:hypothetical protein
MCVPLFFAPRKVTVYHAAAATQEAMEGATARAMLSAPGASAEPVVEPPTEDEEGVSFANVGWTGWLGSITGMSSERVAISEIGVSFPDASFGNESRVGNPFTFLLRDIIQVNNLLTPLNTVLIPLNNLLTHFSATSFSSIRLSPPGLTALRRPRGRVT